MPDPQALQLTLFSAGLGLTGTVLLLAFRRTDRARCRIPRLLRLPRLITAVCCFGLRRFLGTQRRAMSRKLARFENVGT